jgi:copper transport protein
VGHLSVRRSRTGIPALLSALATLVLVAGIILGSASPASAHASLVATDPGEGSVLETAPEQVVFSFSEDVQEIPGGVQVFDATGAEVDASARAQGDELVVTLDEEIGEGTTVVAYRVLSRDGHPASGSLSFSVGEPSATVVAPLPLGEFGEAGAVVAPWWVSAMRWVGYLGLLLAAGLVAFAVLLLPRDRVADQARGRVVATARAGAGASTTAWVLGLPVTAAYQVGGGLGSLTDGATWSVLTTTEYAVTAAIALGLVAAVALLGAGRPGRGRGRAALVAAAVATCAPAFTGHTRAATPEALAIGADMVHLLAGATWLGGLVALALALPRLAAQGSTGAEVLTRFSTMAAAVVGVLAVTGTLLAWRIAGSWDNLFGTTYGRLLLVKIAAALVVVAIAAFNRFRLLPGLQQAEKRKERRSGAGLVVRTIKAEAGVLLVVLLLTGLLVDRTPDQPAPVAGGLDTSLPVSRDARLGPIGLRATLSSQATGVNTVTVELLDPAGAPTEGVEPPLAAIRSEQVDLGPIDLESTGPGTYEGTVTLPTPGTWDLTVSVQISDDQLPEQAPQATIGFNVTGGEAQIG